MVEDPKTTAVQSEDDLIAINKKIISLGEQYNKLVVATCDVHFLNPEDEVYRRIIMNSKGFKDADNQAPLFLRTTEEMLNEFRYLSTEKAEELVITNPRRIMDMVEKISPVRPDKCAPVIMAFLAVVMRRQRVDFRDTGHGRDKGGTNRASRSH